MNDMYVSSRNTESTKSHEFISGMIQTLSQCVFLNHIQIKHICFHILSKNGETSVYSAFDCTGTTKAEIEVQKVNFSDIQHELDQKGNQKGDLLTPNLPKFCVLIRAHLFQLVPPKTSRLVLSTQCTETTHWL